MKKILIYIENAWVFGKIHNELIKALYPEVYCDILDWIKFTDDVSFKHLSDKYDYILTAPAMCLKLRTVLNIPFEKMIAYVHGNWDMYAAIQDGMTSAQFSSLGGYFCIAPLLQHISISHAIERLPTVLPIGIFQNNYPRNVSQRPSRIGLFSRAYRADHGHDLKRGCLVEDIARKTNLELVSTVDINYLAAERLYAGVDLVINSSLSEGNPYPMLEAFACGIPCLSTPTGIATEYLQHGGGVLLPMEADDLVYKATYEIAKMLQGDNRYYRQRADEAYEIGKTIDWSRLRDTWINYINSL